MASCDPSTLLAAGKAFQRVSQRDLRIVIAQLLCQTAAAGGLGAGQTLTGSVVNPNMGITPANTARAALYYQDNTVDPNWWRWDVTGQKWLQILGPQKVEFPPDATDWEWGEENSGGNSHPKIIAFLGSTTFPRFIWHAGPVGDAFAYDGNEALTNLPLLNLFTLTGNDQPYEWGVAWANADGEQISEYCPTQTFTP